MPSLKITLDRITKRYTQRSVFNPVTFTANPGEIIAITGENGAGKSTLMKIVAGVLSPSKGTCTWSEDTRVIDPDEKRFRLGFAAPYLELYDELTASEHLEFVLTLKKQPSDSAMLRGELRSFGLNEEAIRTGRHVRAFSSGMKQRVRLAMAFAGNPDVIFLDEPTANLDESGAAIVLRNAELAAQAGASVWIATNTERERGIAHRELHLEAPYQR